MSGDVRVALAVAIVGLVVLWLLRRHAEIRVSDLERIDSPRPNDEPRHVRIVE